MEVEEDTREDDSTRLALRFIKECNVCVCVYWLLVLSDVPPLFLECICGIEKWQDLIFCSTINMNKKNTATK